MEKRCRSCEYYTKQIENKEEIEETFGIERGEYNWNYEECRKTCPFLPCTIRRRVHYLKKYMREYMKKRRNRAQKGGELNG